MANSPHDFENESIRRELRSYDIKPDFTLGDYEVMHDFGPARGVDGMTLDSKGNIVATAGFKKGCLLYTSPSPRDAHESRMPSSA